MLLLYISIPLLLLYAGLLIYYTRAWHAVPGFGIPLVIRPEKITVLIPARNEEQHIGALLRALEAQDYPKAFTEIIVIDDHSTDATAAVVQQYPQVTLLRLHADTGQAHKKKAIEQGVAAATGTFIICTDADCIPGPRWLSTYAAFREKTKAVFIAAPVVFTRKNGFLSKFQSLDFMVLQGITAAAVHTGAHAMSNGANLGYTREAFYKVNGFEGIDHIASGDDMLLMQKINTAYPGKTAYLKAKEAIVQTAPMPDLRSFLQQRIRWASKARYYSDKKIVAVLALVYLVNLQFVFLAVAACFSPVYGKILLAGLLLKTVLEWPFVYTVAAFFNQQALLRWFILFQPFHIVYTVCSGFLGQVGRYEWKGRRVK